MKSRLLFFIICGVSLRNFAGEPLRAPELAALPHSTTTAAQRQRIVAVTRALELAPFGDVATRDREWALSLVDHSPDIFPAIRERLFGEIAHSQLPDRRAIYAQFVLGFVAFQLEHSERAGDAVTVYQEAVRSALRVYRRALERNGANRVPALDAVNPDDPNGLFEKSIATLVEQPLVAGAK